MLMGSPVLVAYGLVSAAPWFYYALLIPFIVTFVYVPAGVGAIICLLIVNWLPRVRVHAFTVTALVLAAISVWMAWSMLTDVGST